MPGVATAQTPAAIPFRYQASKIFVPTVINGRPTWALIDTGAKTAALSHGFAMHIGSRGRPVSVRGAARATSTAQLHTNLSVIMGEVLMQDVSAIAIDLDPLSRLLGREVGAIVGLDLFQRYVVGFDFDDGMMTLTPRTEFRPVAEAPVALPHVNNMMALWVKLNGGAADLAMLDLGSSDCLIVSPDVAAGRGLLQGVKVSETVLNLADGQVVAKCATARTIEFAGRTFENAPFCVMPTGDHRLIIGMGLLRRFDLTLDFTGQKSWLTPNTAVRMGFRKDVLGLLLSPDRRVLHVPPGSPAEVAGVKVGDLVAGYSDEGLARRLVGPNPPLGQTLVVRFGDGSEKTLVAAEYY
jgi:predicted aspartyl protease